MRKLILWVIHLYLFMILTGLPAYARETSFRVQIAPVPTPLMSVKTLSSDNRAWRNSPYFGIILPTARKYNLDPQLIYATIMTESGGNTYAYRYESHLDESSLGLGQILVSTARSLGFRGNPQELFRAEINIDLIGKYHRKMLDRYGNLTPAQLTVAYNTGSPWKSPVRGHLDRFQKWFLEEA